MKNLVDTIVNAIISFVTSFVGSISAASIEEVLSLIKSTANELYQLKNTISNAIDVQAERLDALFDELDTAMKKKAYLERCIKGCNHCELALKSLVASYESLIRFQTDNNAKAKELGIDTDTTVIDAANKKLANVNEKLSHVNAKREQFEKELGAVNKMLKNYIKDQKTARKVCEVTPKAKSPVATKFVPLEYSVTLKTEDVKVYDEDTHGKCVAFAPLNDVRFWLDRAIKTCNTIRTSTTYKCYVRQVNEHNAYVKRIMTVDGKVVADAKATIPDARTLAQQSAKEGDMTMADAVAKYGFGDEKKAANQ